MTGEDVGMMAGFSRWNWFFLSIFLSSAYSIDLSSLWDHIYAAESNSLLSNYSVEYLVVK